jgi:hypothetical protein
VGVGSQRSSGVPPVGLDLQGRKERVKDRGQGECPSVVIRSASAAGKFGVCISGFITGKWEV